MRLPLQCAELLLLLRPRRSLLQDACFLRSMRRHPLRRTRPHSRSLCRRSKLLAEALESARCCSVWQRLPPELRSISYFGTTITRTAPHKEHLGLALIGRDQGS